MWTPPVAMILMASAPASMRRWTAAATPSASSARAPDPARRARSSSSRPARRRGSAVAVDQTVPGIASRRMKTAGSGPPRSRTVVTPARRCCWARPAMRTMSRPGLSEAKSSSDLVSPVRQRWTCRSMSPGSRARPARSIRWTSSPARGRCRCGLPGRRDLDDLFAVDQHIGEARLDGRVTVDDERVGEDEHRDLRSGWRGRPELCWLGDGSERRARSQPVPAVSQRPQSAGRARPRACTRGQPREPIDEWRSAGPHASAGRHACRHRPRASDGRTDRRGVVARVVVVA